MTNILCAALVVLLMSCGSDKDTDAPTESRDLSQATVLAAGDAPPTCDMASKGRLIYVVVESKFQYCSGTAWADIDLKGKDGAAGTDGRDGTAGTAGKDGMTVSDRYYYHVDTYVGAIDLEGSSSQVWVNIGDIRVSRFTNGGALVSVSGNYYNSLNSPTIITDWSYTYIAKDVTSAQEVVFKLALAAQTRLKFKVTLLSGSGVNFATAADIDGSWANDAEVTFNLNKE